MRRHPVVEHEDTTHRTICNGADSLTNRQVQMSDGFQNDHHQRCKQADGLKGIRKHQRADAASAGIEPDEQYHTDHIHNERNTSRLEHKLLENDAHYIKPDGSPHHLGKQEEPSTRLIRAIA